MQTYCNNPKKLYEKFNRDVNRNTQKEEWEKIVLELGTAGINVVDIKNLRKNVTNWTRRALVNFFLYVFHFPLDSCQLIIN